MLSFPPMSDAQKVILSIVIVFGYLLVIYAYISPIVGFILILKSKKQTDVAYTETVKFWLGCAHVLTLAPFYLLSMSSGVLNALGYLFLFGLVCCLVKALLAWLSQGAGN